MAWNGLLDFTNGSILGTVKEFRTEEEFIQAVQENRYILADNGIDSISKEYIKRVYVRWFPTQPQDVEGDFPDGCYATTKKGRGAFECFIYE